MIKHGQEKRHFLKDLIPGLHFSENLKNLENLGGVKLKHWLEIQNMSAALYWFVYKHSITSVCSADARGHNAGIFEQHARRGVDSPALSA